MTDKKETTDRNPTHFVSVGQEEPPTTSIDYYIMRIEAGIGSPLVLDSLFFDESGGIDRNVPPAETSLLFVEHQKVISRLGKITLD